MRTIEPAIASYYQDWRRYPPDGFELPSFPNTYPEENPRIWVQITTPVKYFSTIPYDEFHVALKDTNGTIRSDKNKTYRYYGAHWRCLALGGTPTPKSEKCPKLPAGRNYDSEFLGKWVIYSPGPDQLHNFGEWAMWKPSVQNGNPFNYSPTNGTLSRGDIVKWGS
jgi:hypothetical protein